MPTAPGCSCPKLIEALAQCSRNPRQDIAPKANNTMHLKDVQESKCRAKTWRRVHMVTDSDVIKLTTRKSLDCSPRLEYTGLYESCCVAEDGLKSQPFGLHLSSDQITEEDHHIQLIACLKSLNL